MDIYNNNNNIMRVIRHVTAISGHTNTLTRIIVSVYM